MTKTETPAGFWAGALVAFASLMTLSGCSGTAKVVLGPGDLSDDYVKARVDEEYAIAQTCTALGQMRDDVGALHPESHDLFARETALRLGLVLRAANVDAPHCTLHALESLGDCSAEPHRCSIDARTCRGEIDSTLTDEHKKRKVDGDVLAVVGFSFDDRLNDRNKASAVGGRALVVDSASVARRVNTSYATVLTLAAISRRAEQMATDLSASFGWFQGFARPLLDLAAADVVASSMDALLDRLERQQAVTKASVSQQACRLYDRTDPTALVTSRTLRRAILRFSSRDYAKIAEPMRACAELERSSKKAGKSANESAVCARMRAEFPGAKSRPSPDLDLKHGASEATVVSARHAAALRAAAHACLAEETANAGRCTLERVERVASLLAVNGAAAEIESSQADFATLENQLSALGDRLLVVEHKLDAVRVRVDDLNAEAQSGDERLTTSQARIDTKLEMLERRLLRDTMVFAGRAGKACRQYVDTQLDARNRLAQELDLRNDREEPVRTPCTGYDEESPAAGDQRFTSAHIPGMTVQREDLCGGRFVALSFSLEYDVGAFEPPASGRDALAWLSGQLRDGDSVSLVASGGDVLWSRNLTRAFQALPKDVKARYGAELGVADQLAVLRAESVLALLPHLPASVSLASRSMRKTEIAVLLGGPLAFDPMANCPSWPATH